MAAIWYSGYASYGSGYSAKWLLAIPLLTMERGGVLLDAPRTLIFLTSRILSLRKSISIFGPMLQALLPRQAVAV
ncbi:hypothetical protein ASF03_19685 [Rhizobium sp. Leaf68]|nr:hypothetical protein ASE62_17950 [Rhizobium sp. Leaf202]KQN80883.1 hypothetical protein ASF03_19685 [Rhizobium sp. Leaf68]